MLLLVLLGLIFTGILGALILQVMFSESAQNYFTANIIQNLESLLKVFDIKNRMKETASKSWGVTEARNESKLSYCLCQANKKRIIADLSRD